MFGRNGDRGGRIISCLSASLSAGRVKRGGAAAAARTGDGRYDMRRVGESHGVFGIAGGVGRMREPDEVGITTGGRGGRALGNSAYANWASVSDEDEVTDEDAVNGRERGERKRANCVDGDNVSGQKEQSQVWEPKRTPRRGRLPFRAMPENNGAHGNHVMDTRSGRGPTQSSSVRSSLTDGPDAG